MSTQLKPLDAVWLMMESDDTPMHVGVLAIVRKPRAAADDYLEQWVAQMRESRDVVAPWNSRLVKRQGVSIAPRLVEEQDFDLDYHFRHTALPAPGGEREPRALLVTGEEWECKLFVFSKLLPEFGCVPGALLRARDI